jgi:hypothetical protein
MARQIITPGTVRRNPHPVTTKTGVGKLKVFDAKALGRSGENDAIDQKSLLKILLAMSAELMASSLSYLIISL